MAFCTNCGVKLPEGALFCTNCGTKVVNIQPEPAKAQPEQPANAQPEQPKKVREEEIAAAAVMPDPEEVVRQALAEEGIVQPEEQPVPEAPKAEEAGPAPEAPKAEETKPAPEAPKAEKRTPVPEAPQSQEPVHREPQQAPKRPTPPPAYAAPQTAPAEPVYAELSPANEPITTFGYVGIFLLMCLPVINLVLLIVWACGGCRKVNKKNLSRALLIMWGIGLVLAAVVLAMGFFVLGADAMFDLWDTIVEAFQSVF